MVFEFEGQKYEIVEMSDTGDVYSQALLVAYEYQRSLYAKAINSIKECSRCGQRMPHGGERGLVKDGVPYSFCSEQCCWQWVSENDRQLWEETISGR